MAGSTPPPPPDQVMLSTTHDIPGKRTVKCFGIIFGQTVRTRGALGRFVAGFEALLGGRSEAYLTELEKARREALDDMLAKASALGANGVIGVDFDVSEVLEGFVVVTATGTAVYAE